MEFHVLVNWKLLFLKKKNLQQKIDGNFHFRILGLASVPDFK
jgi:hypothetical protein